MILRHTRRAVPQLNTTSTADISFILLVFFLVMTSMDIDKGLSRNLPPYENDEKQEITDVSRSNVMAITITASNQLLVDGKPAEYGKLRSMVMGFVGKTADREKHIILLDIDRNASYDAYFNVQNEIVAAYNILRDSYAVKRFGCLFSKCTPGQRNAVMKYYPQRISEVAHEEKEGGAE